MQTPHTHLDRLRHGGYGPDGREVCESSICAGDQEQLISARQSLVRRSGACWNCGGTGATPGFVRCSVPGCTGAAAARQLERMARGL